MQKFATAGESLLHRVFRQLQFGGHGLNGLVFPVKQNERLAIDFWNSFERPPKNFLLLPTDRIVGRKCFVCGRVLCRLQRLGIVRRLTAFTIKALPTPVSDDATKPGTQFRALTQISEMLPRRNERFLRDILALAEIAN